MNTPNNKRRQESRNRMESAFVQLLQRCEPEELTVTDLCRAANVNRTTFYANYNDLKDLALSVHQRFEAELLSSYEEDDTVSSWRDVGFLKLFQHIYDNQIFYRTYFKLGLGDRLSFSGMDEKLLKAYAGRHAGYHKEFFRSGMVAVIKMWLSGGCSQSPEEISRIIGDEYHGRKRLF